jgi:hypothetical protein
LPCKVKLATVGGHDYAIFRLQAPDDRTTHHTSMARDEDPEAFEVQQRLGIHENSGIV